jgi:hypothetical protein
MENWRDNLPEELRENPTLQKYNSVEDVAKATVEAQSMIGRSLRIPTEDEGPEARKEWLKDVTEKAPELIVRPENEDEFWQMAGVPETPDDYETPENLSPELVGELKKVGEGLKLTKSQFARFVEHYNTVNERQSDLQKQLQEEGDAALKEKWGYTSDRNENLVADIVEKFQDSDLKIQALDAPTKLLLANIAKQFNQDPQAGNQPSVGNDAVSPAEAAEQAENIRNRLIDEGRNINPAERDRLLKKLVQLQEQQRVR